MNKKGIIILLLLFLATVISVILISNFVNNLPTSAKYFKYVKYRSYIEITGYKGDGGRVNIPDEIEGLPVASIGFSAFRELDNKEDRMRITNVTIPDSIFNISDYAFSGCTKLQEFIMSDNVVSIGLNSFSDCYSLKSIRLSNNLTYIPKNAFYRTAIYEINLPEKLKEIDSNAFRSCSNLLSIEFPKSLEKIAAGAFSSCDSLKKIYIPKNIDLMELAFLGCRNIKEFNVDKNNKYYSSSDGLLYNKRKTKLIECLIYKSEYAIPTSLLEIGKSSFRYNEKIRTLNIPDSVKMIDDYAFSLCTNLSNVTFGRNVNRIGKFAFSFTQISNLEFNESVKFIDENSFSDCKALNYINIPDNVTNLGSNSFSDCENVFQIKLGKGITKIPDGAFARNKSIKEINIPNTITSIGDSAFSGCEKLSKITISESVKTIGKMAFSDCSELQGIYFMGDAPKVNIYTFIDSLKAKVYYIKGNKGFSDPWYTLCTYYFEL